MSVASHTLFFHPLRNVVILCSIIFVVSIYQTMPPLSPSLHWSVIDCIQPGLWRNNEKWLIDSQFVKERWLPHWGKPIPSYVIWVLEGKEWQTFPFVCLCRALCLACIMSWTTYPFIDHVNCVTHTHTSRLCVYVGEWVSESMDGRINYKKTGDPSIDQYRDRYGYMSPRTGRRMGRVWRGKNVGQTHTHTHTLSQGWKWKG